MTVACYRIVKRERAATAFDGEGARLFGGRWNSKGKRMVYTSATASLAILETLVHLDSHEVLVKEFCMIVSEFPESVIQELDTASLLKGWDADVPINFTRDVGDRWLNEARSAVLAVPSAVSPTERNYVLNPGHRDFRRIKIGVPRAFAFSPRLVK